MDVKLTHDFCSEGESHAREITEPLRRRRRINDLRGNLHGYIQPSNLSSVFKKHVKNIKKGCANHITIPDPTQLWKLENGRLMDNANLWSSNHYWKLKETGETNKVYIKQIGEVNHKKNFDALRIGQSRVQKLVVILL